MKTENEIFIEAINLLNRIITQYKIFLSEDIISFAKHYIDVDEYEMAFEGLFIDLIKENLQLDASIRKEALQVGIDLKLNTDTVYDSEFWQKFLKYLNLETI